MTILLKKVGSKNPTPVTLRAAAFGKNAYVYFGDIQIGGNAQAMAAELRRLADELEPKTITQARTRAEGLPEELANPETAWPWLVDRFPWLFGGIDLAREPYAKYLDAAQEQQDAAAIAHLDNPSQADVAEVLFGDRTKTGGSYRRRILKAIDALTTTANRATTTPNQRKKAA